MVIPILDKSLPSVIASIDATLRRFDGCPTDALTDNEKTVTTTHVARIAIRNADMVAAARHYGLTIATSVVADPESKGGSEATVRIVKADLVPTDANLLGTYPSFAALEAACEAFCDEVNTRAHRVMRRAPAEMLAEERRRLHRLPASAYTAALGVTRIVGINTPVIAHEGGEYSVPHRLRGETVWIRPHGGDIVITHLGHSGASRSPAMNGPRRAIPVTLMSTSGRPPKVRCIAPPAPATRPRRRPSPGSGRSPVAGRRRRGGCGPAPAQDGRSAEPGRAAREPHGGLGAWPCRGDGPLRRGRPGLDHHPPCLCGLG